MKLYTFWRSTTSYRVRIALNLKGLAWQPRPINLAAGEQFTADYISLNPGEGVPTLVSDDGAVLTQSMAILEWLEETYPDPPILPNEAMARARVRAAALAIATDIHPINNLRVLNKLKAMGHSQADTVAWMQDWIARGLTAYSKMITNDSKYSFGSDPSLADICLVPQLYNAHRWGLEMTPYSRLTEIEKRCLEHPAFDAARPENQSDAG